MHLKGTRRLHVFIAPMDIDDLDARAVVVGSACLGEDPRNSRPGSPTTVGRGDPVGELGVGQKRELDSLDRQDQRSAPCGRRGVGAGVPDAVLVERADRVNDAGLALVERMRRRGRASLPASLTDRCRAAREATYGSDAS
jgi:hypothetical protein